MPLYEYNCDRDGRFELIRKFSDPPVEACPTCGQPVEKLLSSPAIQFKGSGWYITDYARKSNGESKGDAKADAKADSKGDAKADSKSDSKGESKSASSESKPATSASSDSKPAAS